MLKSYTPDEITKILKNSRIYAETGGKEGEIANLTGANLTRDYLRDANLTGANLTGANLTEANLTNANLTDAYLRGANLRGANLRGANLTGANLRGANLTDADLTGATLTKADRLLLSPAKLIVCLQKHAKSECFDQKNWCGTNCCLAGAAGLTIDNQSMGVAVIAQTLPDFNLNVLYKSDPNFAIEELERVAAKIETLE